MSLAFYLRNNLDKIPYSIGKYLANIPFSYRPGIARSYFKSKNEIYNFGKLSSESKKLFIFSRMKDIVMYAYEKIPFYRSYYKLDNFHPKDLKIYEDIDLIPIINKKVLLEWEIDKRSNPNIPCMKINTGGSSGNALSLYIPPIKMGIEWSHYHFIWGEQIKLNPSELQLLVAGRSNVIDKLDYDFVRHCLRMDIYSSHQDISEKFLKTYKNTPIYSIRGYPSAIYEFVVYCKSDKLLLKKIKTNLKGVILHSEYPNEYQRNIIEEILETQTYSYYGHSEGCVIAMESEYNKYLPLHTYGFVESKLINGEQNLIGTNYYNYASPLIRYNTEDIVLDPKYVNNLLTSFHMKEGRVGDVVIDKNNKKIPLTGLIFGRHHKLFDFCSQIQARQLNPGEVKIFYVSKEENSINPVELFDMENIEIDFIFQRINKPIKTATGKVKLLV